MLCAAIEPNLTLLLNKAVSLPTEYFCSLLYYHSANENSTSEH